MNPRERDLLALLEAAISSGEKLVQWTETNYGPAEVSEPLRNTIEAAKKYLEDQDREVFQSN